MARRSREKSVNHKGPPTPRATHYSMRIRELRKSELLQLDRAKFAKRIGVSRPLVSAWERGDYEPSGEKYWRLAALPQPYKKRRWFAERAVLDPRLLDRLFNCAMEDLREEFLPEEGLLIRPFEWDEEEKGSIKVSAWMAPRPAVTRYATMVDWNAEPLFKCRDILLIDTLETDLRNLGEDSLVAINVQRAASDLFVGFPRKQDAGAGTTHWMLKLPNGKEVFLGSSSDAGPMTLLHENSVLGRVIAWVAAESKR